MLVKERVREHGRLRNLTRMEIERMISDLAAEITAEFSDVEPVPLFCFGEEILAHPLDTKRFISYMSRYMVYN